MSRYNRTALLKLTKAMRHIAEACRNLSYGILQTDFEDEIKDLQHVHRKLFDATAEDLRKALRE